MTKLTCSKCGHNLSYVSSSNRSLRSRRSSSSETESTNSMISQNSKMSPILSPDRVASKSVSDSEIAQHPEYVASEPYYRTRQHAASSFNSSSYYSSAHSGPHTPVYRASTQMIYSSPPTPQDRRKSHILSEQRRRELTNCGFAELKHLLNSEPIARALSLGSHNDSDSKIPFDTNSFLGGGNKDSKVATLRKATRAITVLADAINKNDNELVRLSKRKRSPSWNYLSFQANKFSGDQN